MEKHIILNCRSSGAKSGDDSAGPTLGKINNASDELGEMADYPGPIAVLTDALKKKGVRFDKLDFEHGEVEYLQQNVVVLRGAAYEVVHRAFQGNPRWIPGEKTWHSYLRRVALHLKAMFGRFKWGRQFNYAHKRKVSKTSLAIKLPIPQK